MFPTEDQWPQGACTYFLSHFSKKITVIKFLEELKSHSSNWIKTQHPRYGDFYWQGGYGAFSVSP
ncbi:MAG: transposase [Cyclobacteriaceae bacterium]